MSCSHHRKHRIQCELIDEESVGTQTKDIADQNDADEIIPNHTNIYISRADLFFFFLISILPLRVRSGVQQARRAGVHPQPEAFARVAGVCRAPPALVGPSSSTATAERGRILHRRHSRRELVRHVAHVADAVAGRGRGVDAAEG